MSLEFPSLLLRRGRMENEGWSTKAQLEQLQLGGEDGGEALPP